MKINEIFYSLQGEGRNTGRAAVFVRFSGCNLKCSFCDTLFSSYREMSNDDIVAYHEKYYHPSNSMTCLYGSFEDYTAFLKLLDGYFSQYDK